VREPDREIIRTFWLTDVKQLRDRCDQERLGPITNKEIAKEAGIPTSTLSEWMSCKRDYVPEWDRVGLIIESLGGTVKEWVPKWRAARAAYDRLGRAETSPQSGQQPLQPMPPKHPKRFRRIAILAGLVVVAGVGTWLVISAFSNSGPTDAVRPATDVGGARCVKVREDTETVSVFKDSVGRDKWTEWRGGTRFWNAGDTSNPPRYRVPLSNGQYGYVTRDSKYVTQADDCP
jgi:hypothetical protein